VFRGTDAVTFIGFVGRLLPKTTSQVRFYDYSIKYEALTFPRLSPKIPNGL